MSSAGRLALIALGSNEDSLWGIPKDTIQKAMLELAKLAQTDLKFSSLYQTPAFPAGAGPDFVNAAAILYTDMRPAHLLRELHRIEELAGRRRARRWGQRTLDLDLIGLGEEIAPDRDGFDYWHALSLDQQVEQTPDRLILPHPRMQDRPFVLVPLAEVAPGWRHPVLGRTVSELLTLIPEAERAAVTRLSGAEQ